VLRHLVVVLSFCCALPAWAAPELHVGSKRFTESYILGEILTQAATRAGAPARHLQGLGNTAIVLQALRSGAIDVYPEYLGTIDLEILGNHGPTARAGIERQLRALGLGMAVPLGFNDGYALAVRGDEKGLWRLSDLNARPGLRYGLSHEFIGRADGWPGLAARYGLQARPRGLDHGLAYEALAQHQVDVIDIYTTDAKIRQYGLRVLDDDRHYFPRYDAVLLYRLDLPQRLPAAWRALQALAGRISAADMVAMNAAAELDHRPFAAIARAWLDGRALGAPAPATLWTRITADDLGRLTAQHLMLVAVSLLLACLVGIPLGVAAAAWPRVRQPVLALAGVLQTVPALALLAMLIALFGRIGTVPALAALFVYALLPIVRATCTGLLQVPAGMRLAALALGLSARDRLRYVELPLALPVLLSGVKTAAVMAVGTATIAAFIGAGGFGERITTGLALNDTTLMLAGAVPAAALAVLTQVLFELGERSLARRRGRCEAHQP
jgi:osmoprotectant transport system permease protein